MNPSEIYLGLYRFTEIQKSLGERNDISARRAKGLRCNFSGTLERGLVSSVLCSCSRFIECIDLTSSFFHFVMHWQPSRRFGWSSGSRPRHSAQVCIDWIEIKVYVPHKNGSSSALESILWYLWFAFTTCHGKWSVFSCRWVAVRACAPHLWSNKHCPSTRIPSPNEV